MELWWVVQQGASVERMEQAIAGALERRMECSNDPVCFEHEPLGEEENGAACHACVLLPETSCEFANRVG